MSQTMLDEMIKLLHEAEAGDGRITRYKQEWKAAEARLETAKAEVEKLRAAWPCPTCYSKVLSVSGKLRITASNEGLFSAVCDTCHGFECDDFIHPEQTP